MKKMILVFAILMAFMGAFPEQVSIVSAAEEPRLTASASTVRAG